ncbi:MAG: glycosyltransferase family 2 protein [Ruminococcus sp.]|nr:glycosyltransferase family 2 protein [Ruminococcus sp.]
MIGAVILNYNTWSDSKELALNLEKMNIIDHIVLVDNCSTDDSWKHLKELESLKIHTILASSNKGYSAGNNIGIRYLANKVENIEYVFIINPDVIITEECFAEIIRAFSENERYGVLGAIRTDISGSFSQRQCWTYPTVTSEILECFTIYRLLHKKVTIYQFPENSSDVMNVDVVPGCFWGARIALLKEVRYLDEGTFLYYEENILSYKVRNAGYNLGICTRTSYIHNHKSTSNADNEKQMKSHFIMQRSRKYFQKTCISMNSVERIILMICMKFEDIEKKALCTVKKSIKRGENKK